MCEKNTVKEMENRMSENRGNRPGFLSSVIAVTDRRQSRYPFLEQVGLVCALRPKALLLREKDLSLAEYLVLAKKVSDICNKYGVLCILHSFSEAAKALDSPALHLPFAELLRLRDDALWQPPEILGCSVHSKEEAVLAQQLGASYLIAGHVYATDCKRGLPPRGTGYLKEICRSVTVPVYGIGGIRPDEGQMKEVLSCGAKGACIMSGMMRLAK